MNLYKIIGVCMTSLCACVMMKRVKDEYSLYISCALSLICFAAALNISRPVFEYVDTLCKMTVYDDYISIVIKSCTVGIICGFANEIACDCNEKAIGEKIILIGKCTIMLYSVPLIKVLIDGAVSFI